MREDIQQKPVMIAERERSHSDTIAVGEATIAKLRHDVQQKAVIIAKGASIVGFRYDAQQKAIIIAEREATISELKDDVRFL